MLDKNAMARAFGRNAKVVAAQAEGLSHEQSLVQTPYKVNCFNWVVGHMVASRGEILSILGSEAVLGEAALSPYLRESDPITGDGPGVLAFVDLLAALDGSQERIEGALGDAAEAFLAEETEVGDGRSATRSARIAFFYFHDTYHTGQTEILRQVAGANDSII